MSDEPKPSGPHYADPCPYWADSVHCFEVWALFEMPYEGARFVRACGDLPSGTVSMLGYAKRCACGAEVKAR